MPDDFPRRLLKYGASASQLVDLAEGESPRTLRYIDFMRAPSAGRAPVVVESQGHPVGYVFELDDGDSESHTTVSSWVRRVAFRGDANWIGVLRPGRLDVFRAALDGAAAPTAIEGLPAGPLLVPSLTHVPPIGSAVGVRAKLLELLRGSIGRAKDLGVSSHDALSLVGRALFWRFLIDRGLLHGLEYDEVCEGVDGWEDCLSTKTKALQTFAWLARTFNGSLLPFVSSVREIKAEVFSTVVGNISHLATIDGQLALRLPKAWSEVNFAHVPVGLLSEVYEAYAHAEDAKQARAESVFYTPRHIAELVVDEALAAADGIVAPRVLDPAAGAGVFLVAMFRALVGREWERSGRKPSRRIVRRILNEQLVGFDINDSALRLAELALYLTAIELDPEEKPRPLKLLRFEELRGRVLFHNRGDEDEGSLAPVEEPFRAAFDIVIGNPPWTAKAPRSKEKWASATRPLIEQRLGRERAAAFDFPDTNPDLPFVYRAMEWAKPGASIALVTHARWLFARSEPAVRARRDLLESVHVTGVLNGTALRDSNVWPNVRHPFCLLFACNESPPPRAAFLFVSPALDWMPDREQDRIRIDWKDSREVEAATCVGRPSTLKLRFRGTSFDETVLDDLQERGVPLAKYLGSLGTALKNGYQLGGEAGKQSRASELRGLPDLKGSPLEFLINADALPKFSRETLLRPRPRDIYRAPLVLIHESMVADANAPRAALSLADVAFDERFDGVSFAKVRDGASIAAYLQIIIQSSVFRHLLFFLDGQFGIEREVVHLETIESTPVVPWRDLSTDQRSHALQLSRRLRDGMDPELHHSIDRFASDVYGLSRVQREAIADTLATALPTAESKNNAVRPTTDAERKLFASVCQSELRGVLEASGTAAVVRTRDDLRSLGLWRVVQIDRIDGGEAEPPIADLAPRRFVDAADEASASLVTVRIDGRTTLVALLDRYRYWTATRARLLAAALLSEADLHG